MAEVLKERLLPLHESGSNSLEFLQGTDIIVTRGYYCEHGFLSIRPRKCAHGDLTKLSPAPPITKERCTTRRARPETEGHRNRERILQVVSEEAQTADAISVKVGLTVHTVKHHLDSLAISRHVRRSRAVVGHHVRVLYTVEPEYE